MSHTALSTPCLLVEESRLESNLEAMQSRADRQGVALRPHIKTHKSLVLARRQQALGARGITVAKTSEAEVFVDGGFSDVRVAYPVIGEEKLARLAALAQRARISFCVESMPGARAAAAVFAERGQRAEVLLKVDCGYGRVGVPWNDPELVELARTVVQLPSLELVGLLTHAGQSYRGPGDAETAQAALERAAIEERDRMLAAAGRVRHRGLFARPPEISIGSTPSVVVFENRRDGDLAITEVRPGTYVYNDLTQLALGAARLEDCALTVLTTVISRRQASDCCRAVLDAGKKILTADRRAGGTGYGLLLADAGAMSPVVGAEIHSLSEEHGWVRLPTDSRLEIGDRVRVVPNHACLSVNTQDHTHLVRGDEVVETWTVDARGKVT